MSDPMCTVEDNNSSLSMKVTKAKITCISYVLLIKLNSYSLIAVVAIVLIYTHYEFAPPILISAIKISRYLYMTRILTNQFSISVEDPPSPPNKYECHNMVEKCWKKVEINSNKATNIL